MADQSAAARIWRLWVVITILAIFLVGTGGYALIVANGWTYSEFVATTDGDGNSLLYEAVSRPWVKGLADIFLTLGTLGAVSMVYELFTRRRWTEAYAVAIERAGSNLADRIASDVLHLVASDEGFIKTNLTAGQRTSLLQRLILANLDRDADELATTTASLLSGEGRFRDFSVRYIAHDLSRDGCTDSIVEVSYWTTRKPSSFELRFSAVPTGKSVQRPDEPSVGQFQYLSESQEQSARILESFLLSDVLINGENLEIVVDHDPSSFSAKYSAMLVPLKDATEYKVEYSMTWPEPSDGLVLFFEPSQLSRGMEVLCDFSDSAFRAKHTNWHASRSWSSVSVPTTSPLLIGSKTSTWVLPNETVGFVFLRDDGRRAQ